MKLLEICVSRRSRKHILYMYLHFNSTWNVLQVFCLHLAVLDNQKPNTQRNCFLREQFRAGSWDYSRFQKLTDGRIAASLGSWSSSGCLYLGMFISLHGLVLSALLKGRTHWRFSLNCLSIWLCKCYFISSTEVHLQLLLCLSCLSQLLQKEQAWQVKNN